MFWRFFWGGDVGETHVSNLSVFRKFWCRALDAIVWGMLPKKKSRVRYSCEQVSYLSALLIRVAAAPISLDFDGLEMCENSGYVCLMIKLLVTFCQGNETERAEGVAWIAS